MALVKSTKIQDPIRISKTQALEFFLSSIRDPYNPRYCGVCLDGAFSECTDAKWWLQANIEPRTKGSPKHNPELWNAIVKFLFTKRTNKQMEKLLNRLSECNCRMDQEPRIIQRYHEVKEGTSKTSNLRIYNCLSIRDQPDETKRFTKAWFSCLVNLFLSLCIPIERSSQRSTAKGASTSWPINSTDMIPFGADNFVESMLQWYRFIPDPAIFRLMGTILRVSRTLVIPSLIKYKFTTTVVESTKQLVDRILVEHLTESNPKPSTAHVLFKFPWQTSDIICYLGTCIIKVAHDDYKEALFQDCETKAMQICSLLLFMSQALKRYRDPPVYHVNLKALAQLGQELFRFFHMHLPSRPSIPVHPSIQKLDATIPPQNALCSTPRQVVINALRDFRIDTRCSAQGCLNSIHTVGNEFRRCVSCGIVAYCGRECQRKAWKAEVYPHKRICPIFIGLLKKAGGSALFFSGTRGWEEAKTYNILETIFHNWRTAEIDDDDLLLVADWENSIKVSRGYPMLDEKELSPGYADYDDIIALLSTADGGLEPVYLDRHARWPSKIAKQERLLSPRPFREQGGIDPSPLDTHREGPQTKSQNDIRKLCGSSKFLICEPTSLSKFVAL